jgi:hypothetical protein
VDVTRFTKLEWEARQPRAIPSVAVIHKKGSCKLRVRCTSCKSEVILRVTRLVACLKYVAKATVAVASPVAFE